MTLVITAVKPDFVVQLSDMRLTDLSTQAVRNEEQRKAIVLQTADTNQGGGWLVWLRARQTQSQQHR